MSDIGLLAAYAPKLFKEYAENMQALRDHHPELQYNFRNSVYPAIAFNFGPRTVTYLHTDTGNKANGLCAITSMGQFDPKQGGHLILKQLRLVIEFPPRSTILIPSATVTHGNTPILATETRMSVTQYASGGLFRWVRYGFQTEKTLKKEDPRLAKELDALKPMAWKAALDSYSTLSTLRCDREALCTKLAA